MSYSGLNKKALAAALVFLIIPMTKSLAATQLEEMQSGCDLYDELRCPGSYDWKNCRCAGDPVGGTKGKSGGGEKKEEDKWHLNYEVTRPPPSGPFRGGGGTNWHGQEFVMATVSQPVDLVLSSNFVDDFRATTSLRLSKWGAGQPMAGLMYDTNGPGGSADGAVFIGKIASGLILIQQYRSGRWVDVGQPVRANPAAGDQLEIIRSGNRIQFLVNNRVVARLDGFGMRRGIVEVFAGPGVEAVFGNPRVWTRNP